MSKKKKIIIVVSIVAFILIAGGVTATLLVMRHNTTQYDNYVNTSLENVDNWSIQFDSATSHERRVALYHGMSESHVEYLNRESGSNDDIIDLIETTLNSMKEHFFEYYNTSIAEVEKAEIPEHLVEIISAFDDNIQRLSSIKTGISDDGIFNGDTASLERLSDKADGLLSNFGDANSWLEKIAELEERFSTADRDGKLAVFSDILSLQEDFEDSSFTSDLVDSKLSALVTEKRGWFIDWYFDSLALLRLNSGDNPTIEKVIDALIKLNDLALLFASESEVLFTPAGSLVFTESLADATSNNLNVLESAGIKKINDRKFHGDSAEKAIEQLREAFIEWKEDFNDIEHLQTFDEIVQEAIEVGEVEHLKSIRAEAAKTTRVGFT